MLVGDKNHDEKRDFIRMKIDSEVIVWHDGKEYQATCKDLSGSGMLLETNTAFPLGESLDVLIQQKGSNHDPFNATAEVSRVDADAEGAYTVGLSIKQIR